MVPLLVWQALFFALYCCLLLTILLYLYSGRYSNTAAHRRSRTGSVSHTRSFSSNDIECCSRCCFSTITVKELILCSSLLAAFCRVLFLLDPQFESQNVVLRPQSSVASSLFNVEWAASIADALYLLSVILLTAAFVLLVLHYRQTVKAFEAFNGSSRPSVHAIRQLVCSATALMALMLLLTVPFLIAEEMVQKSDRAEMSETGYICAFVFVIGLSCTGLWYARRIRRMHFESTQLRRFSRKVQLVAASGLAMTIILGAAFAWRWRFIARLPLPRSVLEMKEHTTSCTGPAAHTTWCKNYIGFVWLTSSLEIGLYGLLLISIHPNWSNMIRKRMSRASATIMNMFGGGVLTPGGRRGAVGDSQLGVQSHSNGYEPQQHISNVPDECESRDDNDTMHGLEAGVAYQNPALEPEGTHHGQPSNTGALPGFRVGQFGLSQAPPRPIPSTSFHQYTDSNRVRSRDCSDDIELSSSFRSDGIGSPDGGPTRLTASRVQQTVVAKAVANSVPLSSGRVMQSRTGQLSNSAGTVYQLMGDED